MHSLGRISWTSYPLGYGYQGMATHCSILAWRIPQTEVPGGLQSTGVANSLSTTEWVQDSISLDSRVNVLCVKCSTHISLS